MDDVVRTSTYGPDQKLLNDAEGIADFIYQIGESGKTRRISFYNADGNLTEDSNGIAEYLYKRSLNGLFYLEKHLDAQGVAVAGEDENEVEDEDEDDTSITMAK